jgi:hypothetical protein
MAVALAAAVLAGLITVIVVRATVGTAVNSACQNVTVPAYFYPGPGWTRADDSRPVPAIMILDITGIGAGTSPDHAYQVAVKQAQAAGIEIMGYSATYYAKRSVAAVEADVRDYKAWYGVTDVFLDQVSSGAQEVAYYRELTDYVHRLSHGSTVMLNPGTYPNRAYMSVGDIVLVYEDSYTNLLALQAPRWIRDYPPDKFAFVIYATPRSDLASAIRLSRKWRAGYVYVTNGTQPDPYSSLPGYWAAEDATIAAGCAGLGMCYWHGLRWPARAAVNSVPSRWRVLSAAQNLRRSAAVSLPQSFVYSASSTSFLAFRYGGATMPQVW